MPLDRKEPGDSLVWPAATWNRWARAANALLRTTAGAPIGSPLSWTAGPDGRILARDPGGFWAKLGTESPAGTYTATQQVRDPATSAWIDGPRALTNVIEVNGGAGLGGTVQWVEQGAPGEWLTQAVRLGGATQCGTINFTVRGCGNLLLAGVAVTVYNGPTSASPVLTTGLTNSSGAFAAAIFAAGTYAWSLSKSRFATLTGTSTAACSGSSVTAVGRTLTPATGYVCCGTSISPKIADPIPTTLYLTDANASGLALVRDSVSGIWTGCYPRLNVPGCDTIGGVATFGNYDTAIRYEWNCGVLTQRWPGICGVQPSPRPGTCPGPWGSTGDFFVFGRGPGLTSIPYAASFDFSAGTGTPGLMNGVATISE